MLRRAGGYKIQGRPPQFSPAAMVIRMIRTDLGIIRLAGPYFCNRFYAPGCQAGYRLISIDEMLRFAIRVNDGGITP